MDLSNSHMDEYLQLTSTDKNLYDSLMSSPAIEQSYQDYEYEYDPIPRPVLQYPEYLAYNYNMSTYEPVSSMIYYQEPVVNTIKIHINPFFRKDAPKKTVEPPPSSETEKHQQKPLPSSRVEQNKHKPPSSSSRIKQSQHSSASSRSSSQSRSPSLRPSSPGQQRKAAAQKRRETRKRQTDRRKRYREERELFCKNQSLLMSSKQSKHNKSHQSNDDRWEHKEEKLKRLFQQYSTEDSSIKWKPLELNDCFELYKYALEDYEKFCKN